MPNLLAYGDQLIGGAGGSGGEGGHTIENSAGTDLTQRDTLQFTGYLNASDDATNSRTVVSAAPTTVTWSDWQQMTDQEKEGTHWLVTDVPYAGGTINTEFMTILWENTSPTSSFGAQNVQLLSSNYDFFLVIFRQSTSNSRTFSSIVSEKNDGNINVSIPNASGSYTTTIWRSFNHTHGSTSLQFVDAAVQTNNEARSTDNTYLIPLVIYGFKKTITIDATALVTDISTSASKCMLADGRSVQNAVTVSKQIAFTPAASNIVLDWGEFRQISDMLVSSFGIYYQGSMTQGAAINLGTLNLGTSFPTRIAVPVFNSYNSVDYLGVILFYSNGTLELLPAATKASGEFRICGTIASRIL